MLDPAISDDRNARPGGPKIGAPRDEDIKLVCFRIHAQEFAADIADVKETMPLRPITRVFLTPPWLAGIINLRGDIVAVLDLSRFAGLMPTDIRAESRIIIFRHQDKTAGAVVDELAELRIVQRSRIAPPPSTVTGDAAAMLAGVVTIDDGAPISVLDIASLFHSERLRAFQRGGS